MKRFFRNIGDFFLSVIENVLLIALFAVCGVLAAAALLILIAVMLPICGAIWAIEFGDSFYDALGEFFSTFLDMFKGLFDKD